MKFHSEKKQAILKYLLEKIDQGEKSVSKHVAETFGITQNTIHSYINELVKEGIIQRLQRGRYELVSTTFSCTLKRSEGHLDSDTYAYTVCLKERMKAFPQNIQDIWAYAFSEMTNNVMDHSHAEHLHIRILQNHLKTVACLADDGIGIFRKIKEHFALESLDEAICELFKGKLTTDAANHSGEGIFFSSKLMDHFFILSDGKIFTSNKYDDSYIADLAAQNPKGTLVVMELSNFSHKTSAEIFRQYENDNGDFTKTRIPLKNIFDSSPVSRSQAKRIYNRLDGFHEIILDFDEIEWMGQGFAHQLFVVFQREHPSIQLSPIHMNEAVAKMHRHVTSSTAD